MDFHGVRMAATHFVAQFIDIFELTVENPNKSLGKTVLKMWSQIYYKSNVSKKVVLERSAKIKKNEY